MAEFFVYWNAVVKKIRIHRSACGACKGGAGMHQGRIGERRGSTDGWEPAATYAEAVAISSRIQRERPALRRADCGLCHPGRTGRA